MPAPEFILHFVAPLNRFNLRYMVTGSVASMFYGEPRLTVDVGMLLFLNEKDVSRLCDSFPSNQFYVPPLETIFAEVRRETQGAFNIIEHATGYKADIYLVGRDELNAWAFRQKRTFELHGEPVVMAPPEYVIVRKLEFYREGGSDKHLRDIRSMIKVSGEQLDKPVLDDWVKRRGLADEWAKVSGVK